MRKMLLLLLVSLGLVACGQGPITQTNKTERYTVTMTIDRAQVGPRTVTIAVSDPAGAPADVELVVLAPVMTEMGMAEPELTAARIAPGRYEVRGEPFSMLGIWELNVRISAGGAEETTTFLVEVK